MAKWWPLGAERDDPLREGVIGAAFLPDTGVEDPVRQRWLVRRPVGDDRPPGHLAPVQQQRVAGNGHHVADLHAVVHGNDPVLLHQRGAGVAPVLRSGTDGIGQVAPVDEVRADGVAPVLARVLRRPRLVEQVPAALPEAQSVGVVQRVLRADEVVARSMRVVRFLPPRLPHPLQEGIAPELVFLLLQGLGKLEPRCFRRRKLVHNAPLYTRWMNRCARLAFRYAAAPHSLPWRHTTSSQMTSRGHRIQHGWEPRGACNEVRRSRHA